MIKALFAILLAAALFGCSTAKPKPGSGDGLSLERAVVITGAENEEAGIAAENAWLARRYSGHHKSAQSQLSSGGKRYDKIEITTADGPRTIYFDITDFFGK